MKEQKKKQPTFALNDSGLNFQKRFNLCQTINLD